jgi:hypothetical protein
MIRLATVLLIASAYFSPAHAAEVMPWSEIGHGALERAGQDRVSLSMPAPVEVPHFAVSSAAQAKRPAAEPTEVPLPPSIWMFLAALAAGLMVIRRRADTI